MIADGEEEKLLLQHEHLPNGIDVEEDIMQPPARVDRTEKLRHGRWKVLLLGQVISLLLCGTSIFSENLVSRGLSAPTFQSLSMYILLTLMFLPRLSKETNVWDLLKRNGIHYLLLAVVDVEANYVIVLAFRYTTITSIQILDCFTIVFVMIMARTLLKTMFSQQHYLGAFICIAGMSGIIVSDAQAAAKHSANQSSVTHADQLASSGYFGSGDPSSLTDLLSAGHKPYYRHQSLEGDHQGANPALGDSLVILSSFLYASSNIGQEYVVKERTSTEFLAMIGLFGSVVSGIQSAALEIPEITKADWDTMLILNWIGFALDLFFMYSLVPVLMSWSSATVFNLSLLTADVYTLLYGVLVLGLQFRWPYFVSFATTWIGLSCYTAARSLGTSSAGSNEEDPKKS